MDIIPSILVSLLLMQPSQLLWTTGYKNGHSYNLLFSNTLLGLKSE
jgi:hypothetical protein